MADSLPDPTTAQRPGTPRWVKAIGIVLLAVVLIAVVVMVVGGGQHGPGMHTGTGGGSSPTSAALTSASAVGSTADPAVATRTIEITANDSTTFEPASLSVKTGEIVTFVVTNAGQTAHELTLGDAAMQQEHAAVMAHMPAGMAHDSPNSMAVEPGETKQMTWRFGGAGTLEHGCHEPGHYEAGMREEITVG